MCIKYIVKNIEQIDQVYKTVNRLPNISLVPNPLKKEIQFIQIFVTHIHHFLIVNLNVYCNKMYRSQCGMQIFNFIIAYIKQENVCQSN